MRRTYLSRLASSMSNSAITSLESIVIVARHGERLDYVTRDNGGNWVATAERPFDTPLTTHGEQQGFKLGIQLATETKRLGIPPVTEIYASPFLRTRQTAVAASQGLFSAGCEPHIKIKIEPGLAESFNESWYLSWAIPGSDGTWGYRPDGVTRATHVIHPDTLHPSAKVPVKELLQWKHLTSKEDVGLVENIDEAYESKTSVTNPYTFFPKNLESSEDQRKRMLHAVEEVMEPGKTILLVSHGGPVTHLYEELTGNPWHAHGPSTFCCYSIYKHRPANGNSSWEAIVVNESKYLHETMVQEAHVAKDEESS